MPPTTPTTPTRSNQDPTTTGFDPLCGLEWSDSSSTATKRMKGAKLEVHPDCDDGGTPDYVVTLPKPPKPAGVAAFSFASFSRGKLESVEHRFPATKQARASWAKKTPEERIAAVDAIVAAFGGTERVNRTADRLASVWTRDGVTFAAQAFVPYLEDYADAQYCNPGTPMLSIVVVKAKAANKAARA